MALSRDMPFERDAMLVSEFRGGNGEAFSQLMDIHLPWVFALCRRIAKDEAEDMCQEVFMEAYQGLPKLREPRTFSAWLRSVAWRRCQRHTAKVRHLDCIDPSRMSCDPWATFADGLDLGAAIGQLSLVQRQVAVMSLVYGYGETEISALLGVARGTVKSRLHSARKRLQALLTESEGDVSVDIRERIVREVEGRISEFEEHCTPSEPSEDYLSSLDRNVQWWHDKRQADAEHNAALYGVELKDVGPRMTREKMMSETLSFKGITADHWGIPPHVWGSMMDIRDVSRRLLVPPFTVLRWVREGMPCINYYPLRRYDIGLIPKWLADKGVEAPREGTIKGFDELDRFVLTEVQAGRATIDDALEILNSF